MIAAALGLASVGIYVAIILTEGNNTLLQVVPWAGTMLVASVAALVGAVAPKASLAKGALVTATVLFAVLGFLAILSIGILFVISAGLSAVAYVRATRDERQEAT